MSGEDAEEVVVELKRVEIGAQVKDYVQKHASELEVDENSGKVRVLATGIEFGSTKGDAEANDGPLLKALKKYHEGKKYRMAVAASKAMALAAKYDFLVPHKFHKKWLFCFVCKKQVNPIVEDILNHVESKKCRREREIKAMKKGRGVEAELGEEEASGSDNESEEDVFFDYTGGEGSGSEDEDEEKEKDEAEVDTSSSGEKASRKVSGKKRKERNEAETGSADWRLRKKRRKNANK